MHHVKRLMMIIMSIGAASCRLANVGTSDGPADTNTQQSEALKTQAPVVQPQRQPGSVSQAMPVNFDAQHKLADRLNVRLDYFANSKSGGISIPSCYDEIAGHLVVGRVVCGADEGKSVDVKANQLNQICYTQSVTPKHVAKESVSLPGCVGPSTLQVYKFSPEIKVEALKEGHPP